MNEGLRSLPSHGASPVSIQSRRNPDSQDMHVDRQVDFRIMGPMEFNFQDLMKQVQKIQEQVKSIQEQLSRETVTASSGGGMVTVTVNGRQQLTEVKLDPVCVDSRDIPMLEDLILTAVNQAMQKSRELMAEEMKQLTGGIPLPFDIF